MRTIEVTGEYKKEFKPDEITFTISIEEYWEEEFQKGKEYEDYRTKVNITTIEESLMQELGNMEIDMKSITLKHTGNHWRQRGKDFLIAKTMDIKLGSFAKANELSNALTTRGIRNMSVSKLTLNDRELQDINAKTEALKAAKVKAERIANTIDKKIKDVVSIVEVDSYIGVNPRPYTNSANAMLRSASAEGAQYDNFKKIEIKAVVRVVWELE